MGVGECEKTGPERPDSDERKDFKRSRTLLLKHISELSAVRNWLKYFLTVLTADIPTASRKNETTKTRFSNGSRSITVVLRISDSAFLLTNDPPPNVVNPTPHGA